ncbi:hypothetical protein pipiens_006721 [Culex pipiens pipiens]|uniref:Peptidase S1 domain-containing protein n=1 Tax=Culex pipiens pipiens TaxID=38569 RepID=A0ABD1DPG0_CULPP
MWIALLHIPTASATPAIKTLGNLMAIPPLPPHHQVSLPHQYRPPHIVLPRRNTSNYGGGVNSSLEFNTTKIDRSDINVHRSYSIDRIDDVDRGYHKSRKITYKYPRHGHPKVRPPTLHPKFYTAYSDWSTCDVFCRKRRERYCIVRSKCGFHVHIEERQCHYRFCAPLSIPTDYDRHSKKKKKRIIVEDYDDEDEYSDEDDTEYVIIKKKPKRKRKRPHIVYHRKEGVVPSNHRPTYNDDYDEPVRYTERPTEQRLQNQRKPLKVVLDDFDDKKIFGPSPHYEQRFNTVQKFQRRPHTAVVKRKPSRLMDYFEDYYDHLYRDGTGFANRRDDIQDFDRLRPISEFLIGEQATNSTERTSTQFNQLMESFPTAEPSTNNPHHAKREISNFLEDSTEDSGQNSSEEDALNGTAELSPDGKKYPGGSMLKLGVAATQKKAREKAVFEMPRKVDNPYSKWSRWSKCTAKCTTRRFKRCKVPTMCGNDIIREVAYCYTEGSFCEEWIGHHHLGHSQSARSRSDADQENAIQSFGGGGRRSFLQPEYMPQELNCGLPMVRNKPKKYLYNMLRIIGGKTSKRGQWPWQVAILNRFKEAFCGGTLVAPRWILTAAHCVRKRLFARLGEHHLQQPDGSEIEFRIDFSIKHPRYDKKTVDNDVALLRLPRDVERSAFVGYACLPERFQTLPTGHTCTIIGWGKKRHSDDAGTDVLHEAEVPIITNDKCRAVYHDYTITKNMFCAGHKRGRVDTCAGDSGGPLLCRDTTKVSSPWTIFGITSFGDGCGKKNKFGIYTKLPNYVDWIWSVINCDGNCRT